MNRIRQIENNVSQISLGALIMLVCLSCSISKKELNDLNFKVEVIQNDKTLKRGENNVVKLKKAPFKFRFSLIRINHISLYSSWKDLSEKDREIIAVYSGDQTQIGVAFKATTGTLDKFTPNKVISVGNNLEDQVIYFYDKEIDLNRYDKEKIKKKDVRYSEIEIKYVYDDDKGVRYEINELDNDVIYVEFVAGESERLQREKLILKFE